MNDLIYDYITAGVDMLTTAVILSGVVLLLRGTTILNQYSANQQVTSQKVGYYKEYNIYDNVSGLSSADAISALIYYKDTIDVVVNIGSNQTIYWDKNSKKYIKASGSSVVSSTTSEDTMKSWINSTYLFKSQLCEDGAGNVSNPTNYKGGTITGIYFTKQ